MKKVLVGAVVVLALIGAAAFCEPFVLRVGGVQLSVAAPSDAR